MCEHWKNRNCWIIINYIKAIIRKRWIVARLINSRKLGIRIRKLKEWVSYNIIRIENHSIRKFYFLNKIIKYIIIVNGWT